MEVISNLLSNFLCSNFFAGRSPSASIPHAWRGPQLGALYYALDTPWDTKPLKKCGPTYPLVMSKQLLNMAQSK